MPYLRVAQFLCQFLEDSFEDSVLRLTHTLLRLYFDTARVSFLYAVFKSGSVFVSVSGRLI